MPSRGHQRRIVASAFWPSARLRFDRRAIARVGRRDTCRAGRGDGYRPATAAAGATTAACGDIAAVAAKMRPREIPHHSRRRPHRESYGAMSARNISEFDYNLKLGKRIEEKLKSEGFAETVLLVTRQGEAEPDEARRGRQQEGRRPVRVDPP